MILLSTVIQFTVVQLSYFRSAFTFGNFAIYSEGLVFEDTWASGTLYQKGDVVTYGGYTYIAEQNSTGVAPNTDTAYWKVLTTGYLSQGEYNSAEVYEPGNTVKYGGHTYACKVTTDDEVLNLASASGDGTTATAVFQTTQPSAPYGIGDVVIVAGISVAAYNGTVRVTACTTTGFSYASASFCRWSNWRYCNIYSSSYQHEILGSSC